MKSLMRCAMIGLGLIWLVSGLEAAELELTNAWLFEEGAGKEVVDVVGGLNGVLKGSVSWSGEGVFGKAVQFPGKGDSYVWIPHDDVFDSSPYTIVAWTKYEAASWQYIFWNDGEAWPEVHKKRHIDVWVHDADYPVVMWHNEGGGAEGRLNGKGIIADGTWHHIAVSHDGETFRLYLDGVLDGEAPANDLVVNGEDALWLGARPGDVAATGLMDEVGFFTQALGEAELAKVMEEGLAVLAAVEPQAKLPVIWGQIKSHQD